MSPSDIVGLLIAALGGAAVGVERQWSGHAEGPRAHFAGIRTFTMLGAIGGFSGWLWMTGITAPAAILFAGGVALVAAAYVAGSRHDVAGTTEVAALVVLGGGVPRGDGIAHRRERDRGDHYAATRRKETTARARAAH